MAEPRTIAWPEPPTDPDRAFYDAVRELPDLTVTVDGREKSLRAHGFAPLSPDPARYEARYGPGSCERDEALIRRGLARGAEATLPDTWCGHEGPTLPFDQYKALVAPHSNLGSRTAADLKHGPPPEPLVPPFLSLDPGEAAVIYGPGGVGKGLTAVWLLSRYVRQDPSHQAAILDFENHESEWGRRLRGFGLTKDELERIHYRNPFAQDWEAPHVSLTDAARAIRDDFGTRGVGLIVVDSIVMASEGDPALGGVEAAKKYFSGLATIGIRSVSLGHVAGSAQKWPDKPFGSTYIHNIPRETWAIEQTRNAADDEWDPVISPLSRTIRIELRNQKLSGGDRRPPAIYDVEFFLNGEIKFTPVDDAPKPKDLISAVLRKTPKLTREQIVKAIEEDSGTRISAKAVTNALTKHSDLFSADETKRPFRWSNRG